MANRIAQRLEPAVRQLGRPGGLVFFVDHSLGQANEVLVADDKVRRLVGVDGFALPPIPRGSQDGLFAAVEFARALETPCLVRVCFLGRGVFPDCLLYTSDAADE